MDRDDSYALFSESSEEEEESKQKSKKQKTVGAAYSADLDDVYEDLPEEEMSEESSDEALKNESGGKEEMLHNSIDAKRLTQEEFIEKENEKEASVEGGAEVQVDVTQCDSSIPPDVMTGGELDLVGTDGLEQSKGKSPPAVSIKKQKRIVPKEKQAVVTKVLAPSESLKVPLRQDDDILSSSILSGGVGGSSSGVHVDVSNLSKSDEQDQFLNGFF